MTENRREHGCGSRVGALMVPALSPHLKVVRVECLVARHDERRLDRLLASMADLLVRARDGGRREWRGRSSGSGRNRGSTGGEHTQRLRDLRIHRRLDVCRCSRSSSSGSGRWWRGHIVCDRRRRLGGVDLNGRRTERLGRLRLTRVRRTRYLDRRRLHTNLTLDLGGGEGRGRRDRQASEDASESRAQSAETEEETHPVSDPAHSPSRHSPSAASR